MFAWLANTWRVPELRKRLLFTALILALYRLGSWIPAPGVDSEAIDQYLSSTGGIFNLLNLFSGGALSQFSLFALGIMPYVTASIILQLMTVVVPRLSELQKEGESGTAKINQYTRYLTVVLSAAQALGYAFLFKNQGILEANAGPDGADHRHAHRRQRAPHVDGRADHEARDRQRHLDPDLRVDPDGLPLGVAAWWNGGPMERIFFPLMAVAIVASVVFVQEGQRKIPIQYAKRMVGRRMTSGGSTYLPLRINMAGVIPVIFAAAILAFPPTVASYFPQTQDFINTYFQPGDWLYLLIEGG
jgi:preprotein translocase subunit SecY